MKKIDKKITLNTYCNPLPIPNVPRGKDEWYPFERGMFSHENKPASVTCPDYRSISDPTVFYYDNKWYLYPSYGMAWVSEDFKTWKHFRTEPYCPKYSPAITKWKDKFLLTAWKSPLYVADTPLGPFKELGELIGLDGKTFVPCDPCIFTDDDGRIYLYAFDWKTFSDGSYATGIIGYELDKDNPCKVVAGPIDVVEMNPKQKYWERQGAHFQNERFGWVEGPHLLKYRGRYYMIYASPDTCYPNYCMAVCYSDESPLYGFKTQKRNPLTMRTDGIVSGTGHGCVEKGPNDTLWAFYTIAAPFLHRYERRIGMDLVAVDKNGELYCPNGITNTPQFAPSVIDVNKNPALNDVGLYSLCGRIRPEVSSNAPGREGVFATDESNLSFWQPADNDENPVIELDLLDKYLVGASRVFWREIGLDYANGVTPAPVKYIVEGVLNGETFVLVDASCQTEELNVDYKTFELKECEKVRLKILGTGTKLKVGVIDFTVFGKLAKACK